MRRSAKIKVVLARVPLRKATTAAVSISAPAAPRRVFPAWIDANERGAAVAPTSVTSRVRDGLVLRVVRQPKPAHVRTPSHGSGAR